MKDNAISLSYTYYVIKLHLRASKKVYKSGLEHNVLPNFLSKAILCTL